MDACQLNTAVTAISNHLYSTLPKEEFIFSKVFLLELTRAMCTVETFGHLRKFEEKEKRLHKEE